MNVKHDLFNSLAEKRILTVSSFSNALAYGLAEFSDETSVFRKLTWLNHRIWVSMIKSELPREKTKEVAMKLTKYRSSVENLFEVIETLFCHDCQRKKLSIK